MFVTQEDLTKHHIRDAGVGEASSDVCRDRDNRECRTGGQSRGREQGGSVRC